MAAKGQQKNKEKKDGSSLLSNVSLPAKTDTEMAVLGAMLHRPELLDELMGIVDERAFFSQAHQHIWKALLELKKQGKVIDLVMLNEQVTKLGVSEVCGGAMYLTKMMDSVASPSHALEWAKELRVYSQRRTLIQAGAAMMDQAADLGTDPRTVALDGQNVIQHVLDEHSDGQSCRPEDFVNEWVDRLESLQTQGGPLIKTQYRELNNILAGLFPKEQTVLAGRPSTGKTALGINIIEHAITKGIGCGIFSLEMDKFALMDRFASSNKISQPGAEVEAMRFRDGKFTDGDWQRVYAFAENIRHAPVRMWDRPSLTPTDFYVQCRLWKREIGMQLVILDYLQLMEPDHRGSSREREISEMSRSINCAIKELDLHILLLCQLNRESEKSKKPMLSHLRESGSLEQDADNVLFIVPWKAEEGQTMVPVELDVAKGRKNKVGSVPLHYRSEYLQFVSPALPEGEMEPWDAKLEG